MIVRRTLLSVKQLTPCFGLIQKPQSFSTSSGFANPAPKSLKDIIKMDLFQNESTDAMKQIWRKYYDSKDDSFGLTLSYEEAQKLQIRGQQSPFFVFPITRPKGYFTIVSQVQDSTILFTYLEAYKLNPHSAPPYLVLSLYSDLLQSNHLSFVRGDIVNELDRGESEALVHSFLRCYVQDDALYREHVEKFNHEPQAFDFDAYVTATKIPDSAAY